MKVISGCFAFAAWAALCGCAVSAAEWKMLVEAGGATNVVTAADGRKYAIDVSIEERDGAWRGKIVNREKGAVVLGFELTAGPLVVTPGKSALYLPHVYGRRIRNWPEHGVRQKGSTMWTETANGVFVPFMSKYDAATGSRAVPLPYPSKLATMQWATLNDGEEGFYLASEDPLAGAKDIQIEYDSNAKRIKMGFHFPMFIPEGLSYDVPKVVMKKYAGTWRTAAKAYRAWWDTCRRVVHIPDAVRKDFTGFMMVILKQQNDQIVWPYTDFKSLGDAALAHGFRHVEFHGWGVGGHDKLYPEYDPDPAMGGRDALVKGVKALQGRGLHVSVYSNGQLQQQGGTKWYEEKGRSCPIMRRDGTTMSEYWVKFKDHPGTTFDVVCPASPAWRGQMLKICRDAQSLGFQGFLYDQIGKQWPSLCFDGRHGHRPGAFVFAHDRETMLLDVIGEMHKVDPDFVLWSEAFNDTILDSVALYQGLFYGTDDGYNVANRFVEGNACDMFPEMTFYVFPELILTDRNSTPLCTRKRANGTAVTNLRVDFEVRYSADRDYVERGAEPPEGYYGKIVSKPGEPKLMTKENWRTNRDYLKCVSDFRRANGDLLLCGTFKADEGFSVAGGEKVIANRWDGRNGESGILVWNADDKPAAVKVAFGGNLLSVREPERGEVDAAEPIPPNTLRLYRYRDYKGQQERFSRVGLDEIRLGGEFERRIMMAVTNNLLQAEIEHQFLDRFRAKARSGDSVGTGKLIETAVRFGVYTGDPRVIALKDHVVEELLKAQSPDGYIGCLRRDSRLWGYWDLAETGFIFLGLAADHHYFGSERSLAAARRAADYMIDNWRTMPPGWEDAYISGTAAAVGFPWGLYALYEETGDVKYRDFAVKARHLDTWYRPVTLGRGFGIHGHSATHLHQCLVQSLYRASGVDTPRRATDETVRFMLDGNGTLINGTCGLWECWTDDQDGRLSVGETCSTGYQLWLWDALVREGGIPEARWGDAVERTVYNALFGAQSETGRHIRYYTPLEGKRTYYPSDTYCCPNNFRRIMSELPEFTFYKSASALYANLYTSCTLKTKLASGAVEIVERTDYPTDEKIVFDVAPEKGGSEFDLVLRIPGWCERPSLAVNGEAVAAKRGTLAHVRRRWRRGDRVELTLPMRVRTVAGRRRQAGRVAFMRGPLVYALNPTLNGGGAERAEMKSSRLTAEDQRLAKRREFFALDPADICATMLVDPASVRLVRDDTVRPNGTALKIRVATVGHATGVNEKNSTEITLTEFPDVGATATYFRVSDLSQAEEDGLFK